MNRQLSAAVLATFRDLRSSDLRRTLQGFSEQQWQRKFYWLDASGLALYLLRQLQALKLLDAIPPGVLRQLEQRHADNKRKTDILLSEFVRINSAFQNARLRYVNLKGFTLVPDYCPDLSLRYQTDLDFLIDKTDARRCREILNDHGYVMRAGTDHVMEFQSNGGGVPNIQDLYKAKPQRSIELHLCDHSRSDLQHDLLAGSRHVTLEGIAYPALSSENMFLSQACHLFRHMRSEWTRVSWLLEFRQFVMNYGTPAFWQAVRAKASESQEVVTAVGAAIALAQKAFGEFAPSELSDWTVKRLPRAVALWIDHYGPEILHKNFPGSKLYLILERELATRDNASIMIRHRLFPRHRPKPIVVPAQGAFARLIAGWHQSRYLFFRLRFHIASTAQYLLENRRWRRLRRHSLADDLCASSEYAASAVK